MNVFFTNANPHIAANEHCDVHQVKMIVEYSQLLSTAHHVLGSEENKLSSIYKETHTNHPSAIWVRESRKNYHWLLVCLKQLHRLYTFRTGREHGSKAVLPHLKGYPKGMPDKGFTAPPQAMPIEFQIATGPSGDGVPETTKAYQSYLNYKFDEWASRLKPIATTYTLKKPHWRK